jgi:hypothetical protein
MQDIWVSLHSIRSKSTDFYLHHQPTLDIVTSATTSQKTSTCDAPFKIPLGILGYWTSSTWDLFKIGTPTRPPRGQTYQTLCSYARWSGCLYTSFDQDHDSVFLLFLEHQTSHAACFNARELLYECVFDALLFPSSYRPIGKPVSHHVVTRPTFSSFLDHHIGHPAHHDARKLLYECNNPGI